MTLSIYNSLSKKIEPFHPIHEGQVGLYHCGPTVYDHVHIGNLRSYLFADVLQRTLRVIGGYDVKWVMNITDIDDKMIERSARDFPGDEPLQALGKLADRYTGAYIDDLKAIGVHRADISQLPRATDHIAQMLTIITSLVHDGIAYESGGSFYFGLEKYQARGKHYGVLSNVHFDGQARVIDDQDQKEGVGDFALWKAAREGEPSWDFELDGQHYPGRPGWHIECSAMSEAYLDKPFDIHTGGIDLKFPHHENEIAQSGGKLAHYFMHNEFLNVESAKMSKSAGNFLKLADIGDGLAFRLMCLSAHYRKQMDYSSAGLEAAHNRLSSLREFASKCANNDTPDDGQAAGQLKRDFTAALEADLNTPEALAAVAEFERSAAPNPKNYKILLWADQVLGLQLDRDVEITDAKALDLLEDRIKARQARDYQRSDELRDQLAQHGIGVEDTQGGQLAWKIAK